ncbi:MULTISPECIES: metal-dependent hydrolase [Paenisporosarcina]|uniref:Metal-dependent hydrolase n=1 Tax=Paenisporosarcina quisquiliarum TaxID=365346 RepID=A0A9X3LG57_9BACL|nr:metal-dependent hydrolase [Paenisporosarcina quisquiliarum]MCZ8537313.1 metal-dependent hydrolase [Paenisporosarcina quisquiliarum]
MTGKTHIIGGLAASLAYAQFTTYDPVLLVGAGVVGALIPDICHGGSKIGRTFPLISKLINVIFGHRSFTHSLLFLFIVSLLLKSFVTNEAVTEGILVGMVSHLVLDMMTRNGIKLLFPFKIRVRFPLTTRTGGTVESLVLAALSVLSVYFGYEAFGVYLQ